MKKFTKLVAVFAALMLALACFVACSSGDDGDDSPSTPPSSEEEESKVPGSNTPSDSDNDKAVNALEGLWMQEGTGTMGYYFSNNKYYLTHSTAIEIPSQQNLTDTSGKKYFYTETAGLPYTVSGNKIDGGSIEFTIDGDKLTGNNGGTYVKVNLKK